MTKSFCVKVCEYIEGTDICRGCGRNAEEITAWFTATDGEKIAIAKAAKSRMKVLRKEGKV